MSIRRLRSLFVIILIAAAIARAMAELRPKPVPDVSRHPTVDGGDRPPSPARDPYQAPMVEPAAIDPSLEALPPLEMVQDRADVDPAAEPIADRTWVPALDDQCPAGFPIKAKLSSGIFHAPGQMAYERTNPDRCYPTATAAEDDGLRAAKR